MKALIIGTGTIGNAVAQTFRDAGHEVVQVGRRTGDVQADLTDIASLRTMFAQVGTVDTVASAAGEVFPAPLLDSTDDQWSDSLASKGIGQINLVRAGIDHVNDGGSFILVSGILGDEATNAMTIGASVNSLVEGFVRAATTELPRGLRINCVSPAVLAESTAFHAYFPGFVPVPAHDVALAYLRAASNPYNGQIIRLHRTN